ncbi:MULTISPECIES: XRE family transcriptional regulator [Enterobacterales]|uniref:XRE family transcriptional regulator n=2 Tax=Gammaproteobacteria TaxID=1236 RepID=UPI000847FAEA|nr:MULTISPECIES: XRE family transcriptional regulator [Enterobacterales]WOO50131.1 XRE family transcriptional regulator [Hafnia alvei]MCT6516430.1 XRE family transcriptional regulator [Proteus vulgaris]ODQ02712.1 XRE family transcriptional regulator [Shigella sp. FC130]OEI90999.1 XRE family transcriptional regulator [Shigella sp. FC1655]WPF04595.1 XRE family transcriptional regulator [Proteus vulgaris]
MDKLNDITQLYNNPPKDVKHNRVNHGFTDMILQTKNVATDTLDKLAYLAGIKNAPADDKYLKLNTTNLDALLKSAKSLGYDIEVVSI